MARLGKPLLIISVLHSFLALFLSPSLLFLPLSVSCLKLPSDLLPNDLYLMSKQLCLSLWREGVPSLPTFDYVLNASWAPKLNTSVVN